MGACQARSAPTAAEATARSLPVNAAASLSRASWDAAFPAMSRATLQAKRDEFWDTRVSGRPLVWQTLRMAAEAEDPETGRVLCESAGLSPFEVEGDVCFCYDELGEKYDLPVYMLCDPSNLVEDEWEEGGAGACQTCDEKAEAVVLTFKVRLSTGQDLVLKLPGHVSVLKLKEEIRDRANVAVDRQKVVLHGQLLKDNESLFQRIKDNSLVQVMIRG